MTWLDLAAIAVYAVAVLTIGALAGRRHRSSSDLLLGGRRLPTWAVAGSMVATELSAATFIGVPHAAYTGNWFYLQLAFGALLAKALLAATVIPLYHRMGVVTVYGLLEERYGPRTRRSAALCFAVGRILASGVRLFIAALAFGAVTGLGTAPAIVLCGAVAGLYTLAGGIRSVVWTDLLQAALFILGALCMAGAIVAASQGGLSEIWSWASESQRARIFHWQPFFSLSDPRPFGVALVGAFFLTLATHATDHDMVQRLLTTRTGRQGGLALLWSGLINFPLTLLFLFIGTGLAFFYAGAPEGAPTDPAQVVPVFALEQLSSGLRGLVFAALFAAAMSSLDSAICAIAATWVIDIAPGRRDDEASLVRRTRIASALFCGLLVAAALGMAAYHRALVSGSGEQPALSLVELALSSMTILYGGLLGIFGWGLVSRRRRPDRAGLAGLAAGALVGLALFLHPLALGDTWIAWPWWIPMGATASVGVAWVAARTRAAAA